MFSFKRRRTAAQQKHVAGLFRLLGFTAVCGVVCAGFSIRAARAEVANEAMNVGRQMVELAHSLNTDVTPVTLNGQPMYVGSSLTQEAPRAILDRYEELCQKNLAQSPESWQALATKPGEKPTNNGDFVNSGIMRADGNGEGTVLCFVKGPNSKGTAMEAFKSLGETGELGAVGELRYVFAKKTKKGNTHVLTGWTTGKFNLKEMVPPDDEKDVPGEDFAEVPRMNGSRRVLSARVQGTPFGVNTYTTDMAPSKVVEHYDQTLLKQGWLGIDVEVDKQMKDGNPKQAQGRVFEKDGVVLSLAAHVDDGKTFATFGIAGAQHEEKSSTR